MIYFVQPQGELVVKIGFTSKDPARRIAELQIGNPRELKLLAHCEGSRCDEQAIHRYLDTYRVSGEWFELAGPVTALLWYVQKKGHLPSDCIEPDVKLPTAAALVREFWEHNASECMPETDRDLVVVVKVAGGAHRYGWVNRRGESLDDQSVTATEVAKAMVAAESRDECALMWTMVNLCGAMQGISPDRWDPYWKKESAGSAPAHVWETCAEALGDKWPKLSPVASELLPGQTQTEINRTRNPLAWASHAALCRLRTRALGNLIAIVPSEVK